jgi:CheY-like chemotaxis protein
MVSEDHRVILLLGNNEQDAAQISNYLVSADSNALVHHEKDCAGIIAYLRRCSGKTASDAFQCPRLIILCITNLSNDVVEVLDYLHQDSNLLKTPVLIFSESLSDSDIKLAYSLGANSFLQKPENPAELGEVFREVTEYWLKWNQLPS